MRSKLNYLIGLSFKRKAKTKWFMIANIVLALLIIGIINIDSIIASFGGDFDSKQVIYVVDNTNNTYDYFVKTLDTTGSLLGQDSNYEVKKYEEDVTKIKEFIESSEKKPYVFVFNDSNNTFDATIYSEGYIDTIDYQLLVSAINNTKQEIALLESNIDPDELNTIYQNVVIDRQYVKEDATSDEENMDAIMTSIFPIIILPFFMLTIFLVQMIGAEVNDEKSTRSMEIIISNVSPKTHFFAKVIASNLFILLQGALLLGYSWLGLLIRKIIGGDSIINGIGAEVGGTISNLLNSSGLASKLVYIVPMTLVLMILTFIAYSLFAGILASMSTNSEDYQQVQSPIMIISLIGYYMATMAGIFKGALFIRILSYIPLISAILSPSLLIMGQIGIVDVIISILLMIGFIYLLVKYGLRIYKVGILNYSSSGLFKKMFKALKKDV